MKIDRIVPRQILDSRGTPTVEVDIWLEDGSFGRAAVPSGASTGSHEAHERRDHNKEYGGKSVHKAVDAINEIIAPALIDWDVMDQSAVDEMLMAVDGTPNKSKIGANAILGVSLAIAKAVAHSQKLHFYQYIGQLAGNTDFILPVPMINVLNGGAHASNSTDVQEWMIIPASAQTFADAVRCGSEVFQALKALLKANKQSTLVGDEGGFAPRLQNNEAALLVLERAVTNAGYIWGKDVVIALDVAATEFYKDNVYVFSRNDVKLPSDELAAWYERLLEKYPIVSIEDPFAEDDWSSWTAFTEKHPDVQIVGDDLLATNTMRLQTAITAKAANAILIKPNQIGTLTETIRAVQLAQKNNWHVILSHRSGETEDTSIAHLAVGLGVGQIKTGSMSRSERLAKYNELLRISEDKQVKYISPKI